MQLSQGAPLDLTTKTREGGHHSTPHLVTVVCCTLWLQLAKHHYAEVRQLVAAYTRLLHEDTTVSGETPGQD